jgi:acyl dehydratase
MKHFEDIPIGEKIDIGRHTFTADEIKSFASRFDPQPFHLDEDAAARSHFGRLIASGWHTAAVCMRFLIEHKRREHEDLTQRGEPSSQASVSPGFRDLKWIKPVYAGDTLTFATEVIEKRPLRSRPGWGLVFWLNTGTNQAGELVFSFVGSAFVERHPS